MAKIACMVFLLCAAIVSPAQTLSTLVSFNGTNGSYLWGPVIQGTDGNFYGTTELGGANNSSPCGYAGCGTVFAVTPSGTLTTLHNFNGADGDDPQSGLLQASNGDFYGATNDGGPANVGTIFKITAEGTLTTLHDFSGPDGQTPWGQLIQASDGNLYGATFGGGITEYCPYYNGNGCGTVYKLTPAGTLSTLYKFCSQPNCTDGYWLGAGLVEGRDGNFYGTTVAGGNTSGGGFCSTGGCGTVFKLTAKGVLTTLYRFSGNDGYQPESALVQGRDGNFYGTASDGGAGGGGTIFKISSSGSFTLLYQFCMAGPPCPDGARPEDGLIQGSDGNFYGTTQFGGNSLTCILLLSSGCGTIFKITPAGTLTTLVSFDLADGTNPYGGVIQTADGNLYGTTLAGGGSNNCGPYGCGVVFELELESTTLVVSTLGSGTISSTDGFINCPGVCSHNYSKNAPVTLNASPLQGWSFTGWSGACTGTGSCNLTINQNLAVTANFTQGPVYYTLTVNTAGSGSGTSTDGFINCPGTCSYSYLANTQVTLNASPAYGWTFSGWTGPCMGIGSCNVTMTQPEAVTGVFYQAGQVVDFYPLPPCRAVDTRNDNDPIEGGTSRDFSVASCPGTEPWYTAYSLNVTVVPHRSLGYLTTWPTGEAQPLISTMNSPDGRVKANAAIVPLGNNGLVTVYVTDTSDVILDINGYFAPTQYQYQFFPLPPCRVVDTRAGSQQPHGLGPPFLGNMEIRELPFPSSPCLQGISNPQAYSLNVTVVPNPAGQPLNYLTLWPSDQQQP
ncbi:MAG: choice-of-anchor tandem repeat GloVer-containing protein [Candidatus Korobacteraceae bacterium]